MAADRALSGAIAARICELPAGRAAWQHLLETLGQGLERAQAAGVVRPDLGPGDVETAILGAGFVATTTEDDARWRRFAELVLEGMRAV